MLTGGPGELLRRSSGSDWRAFDARSPLFPAGPCSGILNYRLLRILLLNIDCCSVRLEPIVAEPLNEQQRMKSNPNLAVKSSNS